MSIGWLIVLVVLVIIFIAGNALLLRDLKIRRPKDSQGKNNNDKWDDDDNW